MKSNNTHLQHVPRQISHDQRDGSCNKVGRPVALPVAAAPGASLVHRVLAQVREDSEDDGEAEGVGQRLGCC